MLNSNLDKKTRKPEPVNVKTGVINRELVRLRKRGRRIKKIKLIRIRIANAIYIFGGFYPSVQPITKLIGDIVMPNPNELAKSKKALKQRLSPNLPSTREGIVWVLVAGLLGIVGYDQITATDIENVYNFGLTAFGAVMGLYYAIKNLLKDE